MAKKNYFIGIGGTGARVAESLLHLCAAGLGPADMTMFLIDPDAGNGNVARTKALAEAYKNARSNVKDRAGADVDLFRTVITIPSEFVWSVFDSGDNTLAKHINLATLDTGAEDMAKLARVLFSKDELETKLDEGFRGHPNIGAVVLSNVPSDKDPWKTFWTDVQSAMTEGEVQVYLVGSIFGGTGAAGVPTLASPAVLKYHPHASLGPGRSKIRLGAALVLPYFTFQPGQPAEGEPQMFVTPSDFPVATKAALAFYKTKGLAFDDVYLLGDNGGQSVGTFSPGSTGQSNMPHFTEVTAAFAALDFYETTRPATPAYLHAWRATTQVGWDDIPLTRDATRRIDQQNRVKDQIATFTTFAHVYLGYALPMLDVDGDTIADVWHKEHFGSSWSLRGRDRSKDPRPGRQPLDVVAEYLALYLRWAAALDVAGVHLFDRSQFLDDSGQVVSPKDRTAAVGTSMRTLQGMAYADGTHAFAAFKATLDGTDVRNKPSDAVSNTDRFVNLFWRASRDFARRNYNLQGVERVA